ncbi:glycosyltransferase [Plantibacter sp. YIM 135347]|uniref:glycosyltransferase n=1 Tax=Plantibacter sp. YIM 135347 TaxID=3423919 RepID=UPI003D356F54
MKEQLRRTMRDAVRRSSELPVLSGLAEPHIRRRRRELLATSGLIDREFYEAQRGRPFADDEAVAEDFIESGVEAGYSITPLYLEHWYSDCTDEPAGKRFLSMFFGDEPLASTSPMFDASVWAAQRAGAELTSTRAALIDFIRTADTETAMPGHADALGGSTWGTYRAAAISEANRLRARRVSLETSVHAEQWDESLAASTARRLRARAAEAGARVTIVMPVRDRAATVGAAIDSVIAQSYESWELIVVDDGSDDGTVAVVQDRLADDPRIHLVRQDALGVCAARNRGIREATGEYLAFLDSDNTWQQDFLELTLGGLIADGARAAYAAVEFVHANGVSFFLVGQGSRDDLLLRGNFVDLNSFIVSTELARELGGFDEALRRWVDYDLFLRVFAVTEPVYVPMIGVRYDFSNAVDRISNREPDGWEYVVLQKYLLAAPTVSSDDAPRVPGLVSVLIPTFDDHTMTMRAVRSVRERSGGTPVEIVVVDNGSDDDTFRTLSDLLDGADGVRLVHLDKNVQFALGINVAFAESRGEYVVSLHNDTEVGDDWLAPLLETLESDPTVLGVQPLLIAPDGSIRSAGTVFDGDRVLPWPLLDGLSATDAPTATVTGFRALDSATLLLRASQFAEVHGFDPLFVNGLEDVDLCLRLGAALEGSFAVDPRSTVVHERNGTPTAPHLVDQNRRTFLGRWRGDLPSDADARLSEHQLHLSGYRTGEFFPIAAQSAVEPVLGTGPAPVCVDGPRSRLRWSIKTAAPAGAWGDTWGDTAFAGRLAASLERAGQHVVVDRRERHQNEHDHLEDVVIALRGLDPVPPNPGAVNILWVISHPELVTDAELAAFDLVYAASASWATVASARSGRHVGVLLQATDPAVYFPSDDAVDGSDGGAIVRPVDDAVFVGSTRGVYRDIVRMAVEGGLEPRIYGPGWSSYVDARFIAGEWLAEHDAAAVYRTAGVVLNDHWSDMAREGFVSNRLFDAVASGARVVSDRIDGVDVLFGGAVVTVGAEDDLGVLVRGERTFPDRKHLLEIAETVAREHSFDSRARAMLADVTEWRSLHGAELVHRLPRA